MRPVVKYILVSVALLFCLAAALLMFAISRDQEHFAEAKNECERGCVQDSGGFPDCRNYCASHPDRYP